MGPVSSVKIPPATGAFCYNALLEEVSRRFRSFSFSSSERVRFARQVVVNQEAFSGRSMYFPGRVRLSCLCLRIIGRCEKSFRLQTPSPTNHLRFSISGSSGQRLALHEAYCLQSMSSSGKRCRALFPFGPVLSLLLLFRQQPDAELLLVEGGERRERRRTGKAGHSDNKAL